jgi:hypothetical protein
LFEERGHRCLPSNVHDEAGTPDSVPPRLPCGRTALRTRLTRSRAAGQFRGCLVAGGNHRPDDHPRLSLDSHSAKHIADSREHAPCSAFILSTASRPRLRFPPLLPTLSLEPPSGNGWIDEMKHDGNRRRRFPVRHRQRLSAQ